MFLDCHICIGIHERGWGNHTHTEDPRGRGNPEFLTHPGTPFALDPITASGLHAFIIRLLGEHLPFHYPASPSLPPGPSTLLSVGFACGMLLISFYLYWVHMILNLQSSLSERARPASRLLSWNRMLLMKSSLVGWLPSN